ncbi:MAG TPA: S-methyl-5-thioribose-1-phosphate isomerase [Thermoanaerobaculia bacterium]|nr:S-methyl-5-thioribose-1-phosphate isomerase [Thermoanaerobaculia bacterium]
MSIVTPLLWNSDRLDVLDQRLLPHRIEWISVRDAAATAAAIAGMVVRGAPAIGIAAAYGLALEARRTPALDDLRRAADLLGESRPTAVNLRWALRRMLAVAEASPEPERAALLAREAVRIHEEDVAANREIGRLGSELLSASPTILTHCNAGALATGGYGTALGVVRAAVESGRRVAVFADETRPYLQGARLTAWELDQDAIDVTLITDGMAGHFFQRGTFDAVIVGADRIAANGDTANKIGTYMLAVLAQKHGVPFYVAAPTSTVDLATPDGAAIPIEERSSAEVAEIVGCDERGTLTTLRLAPAGVPARHPAFDVTPAEMITAIITERGVARSPYRESLAALMR